MPSADVVKKALEQIRKRPANHDYFFSKLTSADWISPLDQAGLFSSPPPAVKVGDGISFPFWPESQYLARIAADAPEQVASIMMKMHETDNVRVHEDLVLAATRLPADLAARWAKKEALWINQQSHLYFLLPAALGNLIETLAKAGKSEESLALAKVVLAINLVGDSNRRASARFDVWNYKQLLQKNFPEVIRHTGLKGLALLCDLLERTLFENSNEAVDYSWIWRPAIEPHPQNLGHSDIRDALIDTIRDTSKLLMHNEMVIDSIFEEMLRRNPCIFKRIVLHLLAEKHTHPAAREFACNKEAFLDERLWHEYSHLLSVVFSDLSEKEQQTVLTWIEEGPPHHSDDDVGDEDSWKKRQACWQAKRLHCIRGQIPDYWESRYLKIIGEFGEPDHPEFVFYKTFWTGPTSPKDASELEAMEATDIAVFLKDWQPNYKWHTPEPEGLSRILKSVVAKYSGRFVEVLHTFRDIDQTYARALVQGLDEAVKAGQQVVWPDVLDYLDWIVAQPRNEIRKTNGRLDKDPHWGWARKAVACLLSTGFKENSIDFALRDKSWSLLKALCSDPDPTVEDDENSIMDPATRSINTTRGEAMHAVMRYALWVRQQLVGKEKEHKNYTFEMSSIPEVGAILERHLDPSVEQSTAVRAVYGQWFPWLHMLDKLWTESKIDEIFSTKDRILRNAAWHSYLTLCPVYDEPFRILRGLYSAGVDDLKSDDVDTNWHEQHGEHLGEHLMVMLGRGVLTWTSENGLVRRFFENSTVQDASFAISFIGRSLQNESNEIPQEVIERFSALWENLTTYVSTCAEEKKQILRPFGWWFASGRLPPSLAFTQLRATIDETGGIDPDFLVMERLAELTDQYPDEAVVILRTLTRRDEQRWILLGCKDSAITILSKALRSSSTRSEATSLIHELGARGFTQFRNLLSDKA